MATALGARAGGLAAGLGDEIAAAASHTDVLSALEALLQARGAVVDHAPLACFDRAMRVDLRRALARPGMRDQLPWQVGEALAAQVRKAWGLGAGPIDNARLAGIVGSDPKLFDSPQGPALPMVLDAAAFRDAREPERFRVVIRSPFPENRRFHFARLLIDQGIAEDKEQLLPAAIDDDDVADAAREYGVSQRLVLSMLVNKGDLDRARLPMA